MKDLIGYVDDLKEVCGSDYKAAKKLGVAKATISKLRTRQQLSDDLAIKIARIIKVDPGDILLAAMIARSKGDVKKAWEKFSRNAALTMNSFIVLGVVRPALDRVAKSFFEGVKCILCKIGQCAKNRIFSYTEKSNSKRTCHGFLFIAPGSWFND